jgi:hypothetical protein
MKRTIAIIGEGITEKYYIESLKGLTPFTVLPQALGRKASSLKELDKAIHDSIQKGFDEVYCLIDMDGKQEGTSKANYNKLKTKYHNRIHGKKKDGIQCKVEFIETERCTELWFLYHFTKTAITREFCNYEELQAELRRYRPQYEKTEKYFRAVSSLHAEMTTKRGSHGSLGNALKNAKDSVATRDRDSRPYTYSEMFRLFEALGFDI